MKSLMMGMLLVSTLSASAVEKSAPQRSIKVAAVCFKTGEQTAGMNKICYYDCLGSPAAVTVGALEFCPMSINR